MMLRIFGNHVPAALLFLLMSESVLILGIFHLAAIKSIAFPGLPEYGQRGVIPILLTFVCQLCLYYCDLYDLKAVRSARRSCVHLLQALGVCSVLFGAVYALFSPASIDPGLYVQAVFILFGVLICWRTAFFWLCNRRRLK